jgi:hypothetical protein
MVDVPLVPLSFIAGPAVLANACAIMQNGASIRYNLAVQQLRELRTRAQETTLPSLYEDPRQAAQLSETRVLVLLRQLELLLTAAWLFGLTSVMAVVSSMLAERQSELAAPSTFVTIGVGGVGLALWLRASLGFRSECICARQLVRLRSRADLKDASVTPPQR